jgi:hypothetical protein
MSKISITISIAVLAIAGMITCFSLNYLGYFDVYLNSDEKVVATKNTGAIYPTFPDSFFKFDYEQDYLANISNMAAKKLSASNPIRYCGDYFDENDSSPEDTEAKPVFQPGQLFDCKEFGTGNSIIKTINSQPFNFRSKDGDFVYRSGDRTIYKIGSAIMVRDNEDDRHNADSDPHCHIIIFEGEKIVFKMDSDEYPCGDLASVEYNGKALIILQEPRPIANDYTHESFFFYAGKNRLHKLGKLVISDAGMLNANKFWATGNSIYFWVYDGRYEWQFSSSHNGSTYSFIPRVYKISPTATSCLVTEGPSISQTIKQMYVNQLSQIRLAFEKLDTETANYYVEYESFLAYWIGMARYTLKGKALETEFTEIEKVADKISPSLRPEEIYNDIGQNWNGVGEKD